MQQGQAEGMEGHACHDKASNNIELKQGGDHICLHCDISSPAATQTLKTDFSEGQIASVDNEYSLLDKGFSNSYKKWAALKPPGLSQPIHLLNSTFII
jgi:hypothetical protein